MSVRYTGGSVGRFTFAHANRLSDAADAIETRQPESPKQLRFGAAPIVAVLVSRAPGQWFGSGSTAREVWNWTEAGVSMVGESRRVTSYARGIDSTDFGDVPNGRAVMLSGTAKPGDIVTVFPLNDETDEAWYAFAGRPTVTGQTSMLRLTGYQDLGEGMFTYQVQPIHWPDDDRSDLPAGIGYNLYERSDRHGQRLTFSNPDSRLIVEGPVQGPVFGVIASAPNLPVVWVFDVPNPLNVECVTDVPQLIEQTLRDGI